MPLGKGTFLIGSPEVERGLYSRSVLLLCEHNVTGSFGLIINKLLDVDFPEGSFDLIINCSSIEHIGLAGRYGQRENYLDGDLEVMTKMRRLLKTTGRMLLTIPIGKDAVFPQLHRVYGKERIQKLLKDYTVEKKEFWIKNNKNKWVLSEESVALEKVPREDFYCLGCFILRPKSK